MSNSGGGHVGNGRGLSVGNSGDDVGLLSVHGTGDGDLVRGSNVLVHNNGALNGNGHMDGHVNVVVLDLDLGDDVGLLRGDPGVGPHRGEVFCWTTVSAGA